MSINDNGTYDEKNNPGMKCDTDLTENFPETFGDDTDSDTDNLIEALKFSGSWNNGLSDNEAYTESVLTDDIGSNDNNLENKADLTGGSGFEANLTDRSVSESNIKLNSDTESELNQIQENTELKTEKNQENVSIPDDAGQKDEIHTGESLADSTGTNAEEIRKKRKKIIIKSLRILFTIGFIAFLALFINEVLIQPYKMKKSIEKAKELYDSSFEKIGQDKDAYEINTALSTENDNGTADINQDGEAKEAVIRDPNRDEKGRLIKFKKLLEINEDVKGWIRIDNVNGENDTKIDYVVVQSGPEDPEFYLTRDWVTKSYLKAGSIFLDYTSSVETNTKNLVIHGHNMTSSDDMFHYLTKYKDINFLKEHPLISFDTIYEEGLWKIFSVFITPGDNSKGDFFSFNRSTFKDDREFLEFVYQVRARSLFNIDDVDINENDRILTLSTCSYELDNYRIIIVARKVRENEDPAVKTDNIKKNKNVLYPQSFYDHYGGKPPAIPSFEDALQDGAIPWYNSVNR